MEQPQNSSFSKCQRSKWSSDYHVQFSCTIWSMWLPPQNCICRHQNLPVGVFKVWIFCMWWGHVWTMSINNAWWTAAVIEWSLWKHWSLYTTSYCNTTSPFSLNREQSTYWWRQIHTIFRNFECSISILPSTIKIFSTLFPELIYYEMVIIHHLKSNQLFSMHMSYAVFAISCFLLGHKLYCWLGWYS